MSEKQINDIIWKICKTVLWQKNVAEQAAFNLAAAVPEEDIEVKKYIRLCLIIMILGYVLLPTAALGACSHPSVSIDYYMDPKPTCTEYGVKYKCCLFCGWIDWGNPIRVEKADHQFTTHKVKKEATCKEPGIIVYICKNCGYEKEEEIPKTNDHVYGEWKVSEGATCTEAGTRTRTCTLCGHTETETVKAGSNHQFGEWKVTKEATCTSAGTRTRTCSKCGKTETETIPADGAHTFGEWKIIQEATCTKSGTRTRTCSTCSKTETETIPAGGQNHKYTEWEVIKEPTCTKKGQEMRRCRVCGDLQYKQLPMAEHTFSEWTVTKEANCKQEGKRTGTCTVCGKKITEKIPRTEHDFEKWVIEVPETDCTMGRRSSTCRLCGKKQVEDYYPEGTLYKGGDNPPNEVVELQEALAVLDLFKGKISGEYDNATADAVKKFEKSVGMKQDGICWPKIKKLLGLGSGASDPISSNTSKGKLKLEAVVVSPRNDDYIPGDQITIRWSLTNTSKKNAAKSIRFYRFTGQKANKNKDLEIMQHDVLAKEEVLTDTYVYTVTPEDVERSEFVLSFIGRCRFGSTNAESNTVRFVFSGSASRQGGGGDGSWSLPDDSGATSGDDGGDGSWTPPADPDEVSAPGALETGVHICGRVLIAEGEDRIEYEIIECDRHENTVAESGRLMEAGDYAGAIQLWNDEIARLYQDLADRANDEGKRHADEERAAFEKQMNTLESSLRLICSEGDAAAAVVQERMNHCLGLCYETSTAPAPRTDSFLGSHTVLNSADGNSACGRDFVSTGSGSVHVITRLCADHRATLSAVLQTVRSAGSSEEKAAAWQNAQKKWLRALNVMYDLWYLSADKSVRETIAADRLSFDELVDARRNTLSDLYPENPAAAEETLAVMIMERTELICGLLRQAGILTDAP